MPFWSRGLLKISIIGTGRHSLNIRKICNSIKNLKIDFLFSRKKKYIKGYKVTKSFKDLLNSEIIFICVPPSMHLNVLKKLHNLKFKNYIICEKPLVLNPWNIDALSNIEKETGKKIYNILQLRVHPSIIALKHKIDNGPKDKIYDIDLTYITSRGYWYYTSWKGDVTKSGARIKSKKYFKKC